MKEDIKIVSEFYDKSVEIEWNRIVNRPEFLLTCRMLDRYIKPGDTVLDIGGGPGRYSFHLADKGCEVTLIDLSSENVKFAQAHLTQKGSRVTAICNDARDVDKVVFGKYDHVLLMGPLYHLLDEAERIIAVETALRLLKPGGLLFAAFISMSGGLVYMLREMPAQFAEPDEERFLKPLVEGRSYGGMAFTQAFFINQNEVQPFMSQFPLEKLHLFGQESFLAPNEHSIMTQPPEVVEAIFNLAEEMCEKEEYLSWSEHLMYIGRKKDDVIIPDDTDIIRDESVIKSDIAYYNSLPCVFEGFIDLPCLSDDVIHLVCITKSPAIPEKKWVPNYQFYICKGSQRVGEINLRIGYTDGLYYGGQIGYNIDEPYRGNGYAGRACKLVATVANAHGMIRLLITTNYPNKSSKRVCEKLGARLLRVVRLPQWHDLYKLGQRYQNIYEWDLEEK